ADFGFGVEGNTFEAAAICRVVAHGAVLLMFADYRPASVRTATGAAYLRPMSGYGLWCNQG
ncbi:MAG: hypothetical protein NTV76_13715, partial [Pseudomonas sp.]|nr:hypothetical protein [Pseudomonas sp.]